MNILSCSYRMYSEESENKGLRDKKGNHNLAFEVDPRLLGDNCYLCPSPSSIALLPSHILTFDPYQV